MKINNTSLATSRMDSKQASFKAGNPGFADKSKQFVKDLVEPQRLGNMGRWLFLGTAFVFLLGGRIIGSRDKNEKRETITRDVPTIAVVAGAVPILEKWMSKIIQKRSGFAILGNEKEKEAEDTYAAIKAGTKEPSALKKLAKSLDIVSYAKLKNWYVFDENLASGFQGFCERLSNLGGNLKKIFSSLNDDTKAKLSALSSDNKEFMAQLLDNKGITTEKLEEHKKLLQNIIKEFKNHENNALKQAEFKKALPKLISISGTLALLGVFIPLFNIWVTEQVNKKEGKEV